MTYGPDFCNSPHPDSPAGRAEPVNTREDVAKAIYCVARPGHTWFHEPPAVLEYWGALADAAIAAYWDASGERAAVSPGVLPVPSPTVSAQRVQPRPDGAL